MSKDLVGSSDGQTQPRAPSCHTRCGPWLAGLNSYRCLRRLPQLIDLSRKIWRTRAYGDFWSYMLLAEGALEIVAEHDLKIYDIAALVPIVEQAGGKFSDLDGELNAESASVLATNSTLHAATAAALKA